MKTIRKLIIMFMVSMTVLLGSLTCNAYAERYRINNTSLDFKKVVYVNPAGSDTEGDGSLARPFQTLYKCLDYLSSNNFKDNSAIVMDNGDYDWTAISSGYSCNLNSKFVNMKVSFIAKNPGKTYIHSRNGLELLILEQNSSWRINLKFYGLIFHNVSGDGNYTCLGADSWGNEYYNCVFDRLEVGGWNCLDKNAFIKTQNCLFNYCSANVFYSWVSLTGQSINTASTNGVIDPYRGTKTSCLTSVTTNYDYAITSGSWKNNGQGINPDHSKADIGVYGGEFSWGGWRIHNDSAVLDINPEQESISMSQKASADLVINNVSNIAAEEVTIKYDNQKLKFLGVKAMDGVRITKCKNNNGELNLVLINKGQDNIINTKKVLAKLNFQAISNGDASIDVIKGSVSNCNSLIRDIKEQELGMNYITIEK